MSERGKRPEGSLKKIQNGKENDFANCCPFILTEVTKEIKFWTARSYRVRERG